MTRSTFLGCGVLDTNAAAQKKHHESLSPEEKTQTLKNNAAAHKKQQESLSPDKIAQILNKDADAHRKQQEALSPKEKAQIVKNYTAAQHKHCKSLSSEQKAQVLKINAAAHKKQYELLPSKKKVRLMETKAEHMTEEEKKITALIRSVAATLYEQVDLDQRTVKFQREHFYKDPILVLAYYHCCSTDPHAAIFNDELKSDVEMSVIWDCISNLIGSPIGQEEKMLCQQTYNNLDQSHTRIAACASCCKRILSADGAAFTNRIAMTSTLQ
jgi:hypothetical protein